MRTTLTVEDGLLTELKQVAARQRVPFKQVVDQALRAGLAAIQRPVPHGRVRQRTFGMGAPSLKLDKALSIAAALEDEETVRKLELRK
jgi:hypothetical protein